MGQIGVKIFNEAPGIFNIIESIDPKKISSSKGNSLLVCLASWDINSQFFVEVAINPIVRDALNKYHVDMGYLDGDEPKFGDVILALEMGYPPSIIAYKDGKEVGRIEGKNISPKSFAEKLCEWYG